MANDKSQQTHTNQMPEQYLISDFNWTYTINGYYFLSLSLSCPLCSSCCPQTLPFLIVFFFLFIHELTFKWNRHFPIPLFLLLLFVNKTLRNEHKKSKLSPYFLKPWYVCMYECCTFADYKFSIHSLLSVALANESFCVYARLTSLKIIKKLWIFFCSKILRLWFWVDQPWWT